MMKIELKGAAELRRKLMAMEKGLAADFLQPIVHTGAMMMEAVMQQLAPRRTSALAVGIHIEDIKAGKGYAYSLVGPDKEQYYARFHEWGLGTGRATQLFGPIQEKTRRRRGNWENSQRIRRELLDKFILGKDVERAYRHRDLGISYGLSRRELRRQMILGKGGYLQGERRPNMAAHPFMRPAVTWCWPYVRQMITERLRALIDKFEAAA